MPKLAEFHYHPSSTSYDYLYNIYLEPKWPISWKIWPIKWKVNPQKRGQLGSRYIYIYIFFFCIILSVSLLGDFSGLPSSTQTQPQSDIIDVEDATNHLTDVYNIHLIYVWINDISYFTNLKKSWHEGTLRTSPTIHNLHHATIIKLVNPVYVIYILCIHVYTESKKYLLYDLSIPLIGDSSGNSVKINKQTHVGKITPCDFQKDVPTGLWPKFDPASSQDQ